MKLTETRVAKAKPGKHGDGRNLWLIVSPAGAKRWEFRYTLAGKSREMSLGSADLMSLDEARDRAIALRRTIRDGLDPLAVRSQQRRKSAATFEEVAEDCIGWLRHEWKSPKSEKQWRQTLTDYAFPRLGTRNVADITTDDVYAVLEPLWVSKPETAGRLRARIEKVLDRATARKLRKGENPARLKGNLEHLLPQLSKIKNVKPHAALPFSEIADFMTDLRGREGVAARALEFAILTATRTGEALGAQWSEIDVTRALWTIPKERMKANKPHRVPLSESVLAILSELPRDPASDYVFISPISKGEPLSNMALLATLKRMKRQDLTAHGFRSTFRDWASEVTHYQGPVVEMALAHTIESKVEAAYRRGDLLEKRRPLMIDWANFCESDSHSTAKVVALRR